MIAVFHFMLMKVFFVVFEHKFESKARPGIAMSASLLNVVIVVQIVAAILKGDGII